MAEFIAFASAAAAVTQLTGQILDAGAKIRSFWNNLQGAPKHVSDLLDDITGLARVINNMPEQENEMVRECCLKVKRIMDELLYQLNILRSDMEKSRKKVRVTWAKFKVVEKKRVLRELTERLEKAKSQLMIANSFYQTSMQANMMQEIIMLRVTLCSSIQTGGAQALNVSDLHGTIIESTTQIEEDAVSNSGGSPAPRAVTRRHRRRPQITIKTYWCGLGRVQKVCSRYDIDQEDEGLPDIEIEKRFLPNRFAAQMGLHGLGKKSSKVFGMWTHSLTPIRVVPDDVPIIQAVVLGDLEAVISLTEQRKATVFDMSERGYTLLHIAAAHFRPELCRWLIAHGLKGDLVDIELGRTPLHIAAWYSGFKNTSIEGEPSFMQRVGCESADEKIEQTIRILVSEGECDPLTQAWGNNKFLWMTPLHRFTGSAKIFTYLLHQDYFMVDTDSSRHEMRDIASVYVRHGGPNSAALAIQCLSKGDGLYYLASKVDLLRGSVLHDIARNISQNQYTSKDWARVGESYRLLLKNTLRAGADVHALDHEQHTPFGTLACRHRTDMQQRVISCHPSKSILTWLDSIRAVGHDLQHYVEKECEIYKGRPLWCSKGCCERPPGRFTRTLILDREPTTDNLILVVKDKGSGGDMCVQQSMFLPRICNKFYSQVQQKNMIITEETRFFITPKVDGVQEFGLIPRETCSPVVDSLSSPVKAVADDYGEDHSV